MEIIGGIARRISRTSPRGIPREIPGITPAYISGKNTSKISWKSQEKKWVVEGILLKKLLLIR